MKSTNKRFATDSAVSFLMGNKALIILVILCFVMSVIEPNFLSSRNLINVVRQVCASAVLGIGYTLVIGSGNFDLSIGCQLGLSGIIMAMLSKTMPLPLALLIGIIFGSCLGMLNASLINIFDLPPFIVTLATSSVFKGASYIITKMVPVSNLPEQFIFLGQGYWLGLPVPIYIMVTVGIVMFVLMNRTRFGRHAISIGGNAEAARVCGVNVKRVRLGVYATMGVCAAIAGIILTGRAASAQVAAGQGMEMDTIAAVVIGGTSMKGGNGNIVGTVIGCLLVGVVVNGLNLTGIDPNWQVIAKGLLILIAIVLDVTSSKFIARRKIHQKS